VGEYPQNAGRFTPDCPADQDRLAAATAAVSLVWSPQLRQDGGVPLYRVAEAADLLGVSNDTLRRWIDAGRIAATTGQDGRAAVTGQDLAQLARALAETSPEGVSHAARASAVSARNRMRGIVTGVKKDTVMAQVEMVCGPYRMVSLMSAEAADELGLEPGVVAIASVKSTNVVVELP
jgi:molybdopterin-binding protein